MQIDFVFHSKNTVYARIFASGHANVEKFFFTTIIKLFVMLHAKKN